MCFIGRPGALAGAEALFHFMPLPASQEWLLIPWLVGERCQGRAPVDPHQGLEGTVIKSAGSGLRPDVSPPTCQSLPQIKDWAAPSLLSAHNYSTDYGNGLVF